MKQLPAGWKETTLGDIVEIVGWWTPKTSEPQYWNWNIPWLSVVDFNNDNRRVYYTEKTITEEGLKNSSTKILNEWDLIISARWTVWALAQLKRDMAFNQSCYGIKQLDGVSDKNFLFYLLKNSIGFLSRNVHWAVFDTITRETFDIIPIHLPPLPEQQAIAAVLSSFDDKIELLRAENQTLEQMGQELFKERFGKWKVGDELPEGWRVGKLGEIAEITSWKRPSEISDTRNSLFEIPLIWATKIMGYVQNFLFDGETLVIGRVWTHWEVQIFYEKIHPSDNTLVIKSNNFYFTYFILKSIDYEKINRGAVQPLITQSDLKNYLVILPDQETLSKFDLVIKLLFNKIRANSEQIQPLSATRDQLLPKLMSGEVRVEF